MSYPLGKVYIHAVDSGIPIPPETKPGRKVGGAVWCYPFEIMMVGQSFFVSINDLGVAGHHKVASSITNFYRRSDGTERQNWKFVYRKRDTVADGEHGVRVWRVG